MWWQSLVEHSSCTQSCAFLNKACNCACEPNFVISYSFSTKMGSLTRPLSVSTKLNTWIDKMHRFERWTFKQLDQETLFTTCCTRPVCCVRLHWPHDTDLLTKPLVWSCMKNSRLNQFLLGQHSFAGCIYMSHRLFNHLKLASLRQLLFSFCIAHYRASFVHMA